MASSSTTYSLGPLVICLGACAAPSPPPPAASSAPVSAPTLAPSDAPRSAAPAPAPGLAFPDLVTRDLNGAVQRVPDGLPGELKLFLVAFQRQQQADVDPWLTLGLRLERTHPRFRVYELPTLSEAWGTAASYIDGGMRRGIRDPEARARTLTLYLDKDQFNKALGLPHEGQVYALLVDAAGQVIWRGAGRPDESSGSALVAEVERRLGG